MKTRTKKIANRENSVPADQFFLKQAEAATLLRCDTRISTSPVDEEAVRSLHQNRSRAVLFKRTDLESHIESQFRVDASLN